MCALRSLRYGACATAVSLRLRTINPEGGASAGGRDPRRCSGDCAAPGLNVLAQPAPRGALLISDQALNVRDHVPGGLPLLLREASGRPEDQLLLIATAPAFPSAAVRFKYRPQRPAPVLNLRRGPQPGEDQGDMKMKNTCDHEPVKMPSERIPRPAWEEDDVRWATCAIDEYA